jgi:ribulose-5-phosphate 4-epimerase/fuculose-1-phosphate aldolase/alpha-ketoglutarate-dependent taurine dioxygenase
METKNSSLRGLLNTKPQAVSIDKVESASLTYLNIHDLKIPVFTGSPTINIVSWIRDHLRDVERCFLENGLALFRSFEVPAGSLGEFSSIITPDLLDYTEPSTPRTRVSDKVYTSTEYPADQRIPMHNEHSYAGNWPMKIWFHCATPADVGGETPIADSTKVYSLIDEKIRSVFREKGVRYVRNFGDYLDLKWQDVFRTTERSVVEDFCNKNDISFEWFEDSRLRTSQRSQGVIEHPITKKQLWFNQAHLFHVSSLEKDIKEFLIDRYGEAFVPRNAYFGDGSPISLEILEEIRNAYNKSTVSFPWQKDDILMLDNMLYAHGREPYEGKRKVFVSMGEAYKKRISPASPGTNVAKGGLQQIRKNTAVHFLKSSNSKLTAREIRYKLAAIYRIMAIEGLDEGISGHITFRDPDNRECFWVNPFGLLAEEVTPENLIKVNKSGDILEGEHPINIAGFCIHSAIHEARPDINCVLHTHSPWGVVFSALNRMIEPIDQNSCMFFENHVLHTDYEGPVNNEPDASSLCHSLGNNNVAILGNHGTITCGADMESATVLMTAVERSYEVNIRAFSAGQPKLIKPEVARQTRDWISNPIGLKVEFDAMVRKVERTFPDFVKYK